MPFTIDAEGAEGKPAAFDMFVIYRHPRDDPAHYVVRRWVLTPDRGEPHEVIARRKTLEAARAAVPPSADHNCGREADDDPVIVEVWA